MLREIDSFVTTQTQSDCVIVCVLSHGNKGSVYGIDSKPVRIEDVENAICVDGLAGIPKILIIQACQGDGIQTAKPVVSIDCV